MNRAFPPITCAFFLMIAAVLQYNAATLRAQLTDLRIMSFNIRYGRANDGPNHWTKRKELVAKTITDYAPDILGTQEALKFQTTFLQEKLPDYEFVGRSREADASKGESCGVYFRRQRFDKLASGHFWLSETPDRPGSRSWDSSLPRMATWVKLWDRENEHSFYFLNTHFDHRGTVARQNSAALIRDFVTKLDSTNVIITGDFNAAVRSSPYQTLFKLSKTKLNLDDTYIAAGNNDRKVQSGTFNGFEGKKSGPRIDWIAVAGFDVQAAAIDWTNQDGRYPSDHFPVTTTVRWSPVGLSLDRK